MTSISIDYTFHAFLRPKKKEGGNYRVGMGVAVKNYPLTRWLSWIFFRGFYFSVFFPSLFLNVGNCVFPIPSCLYFWAVVFFLLFSLFFFFLSFSLFFLQIFIPSEQLFIAHVGGGGGGRGNGRPLTTAYFNFGPSFQLWYFWTVVILVVIRPSCGNLKTEETLKFSIAAFASVL